MQFNKEIEDLLIKHGISLEIGKLCLLGIYYNIDYEELYNSSYLVHKVVKQIQTLDIFTFDFSKEEIVWNMPLFEIAVEEIEDKNWGWINEYREKFKRVNKACGSSFRECKVRMERFFATHPAVRKQDVLKAADIYISSVKDPKYLQQANYFIKKGAFESRLEQYLELVEEIRSQEKNIKMME